MEKTFRRSIGSLETIADFINEFAAEHGLDEQAIFDVGLAIEEIFTNMVKYNTEGTRDIAVGLERCPDHVVVRVTDYDVESFDPTAEMPDIQERLDSRSVGGRGIFLVQQIMDKIEYRYDNRTSTVVMVKILEHPRA